MQQVDRYYSGPCNAIKLNTLPGLSTLSASSGELQGLQACARSVIYVDYNDDNDDDGHDTLALQVLCSKTAIWTPRRSGSGCSGLPGSLV